MKTRNRIETVVFKHRDEFRWEIRKDFSLRASGVRSTEIAARETAKSFELLVEIIGNKIC